MFGVDIRQKLRRGWWFLGIFLVWVVVCCDFGDFGVWFCFLLVRAGVCWFLLFSEFAVACCFWFWCFALWLWCWVGIRQNLVDLALLANFPCRVSSVLLDLQFELVFCLTKSGVDRFWCFVVMVLVILVHFDLGVCCLVCGGRTLTV